MWLLECTLSAFGPLNQLSLRPQEYKCYAPVKVYSHSSQSINLNLNNHTSRKWQRTCLIPPPSGPCDELRAERLKEQEEIFEYLCTSG
ncbi:hypothetical protein EJ06DRAFT_530143 [Trichodelitschia bisporula]|uniref:Uncharacterized protein n=1 Tax=Trichodelitschia bisporula TaxID=703511 RepID=A0A6G1HWC9_9PEZI|nr:hypothetical protein EJ06DRAFT_530143 [Trichodelitschia bisporula]